MKFTSAKEISSQTQVVEGKPESSGATLRTLLETAAK